MTSFFRQLPPKISPPETLPFSSRNFAMIIFSHLLFIQIILKRNFHPKFSDDFLVIIYQTKISLHPIFWENVLHGLWDFLYILTVSLEMVPVRHNLLYDTAILTYKIYIPHFHFPVRRTNAYRHKNALLVISNSYRY